MCVYKSKYLSTVHVWHVSNQHAINCTHWSANATHLLVTQWRSQVTWEQLGHTGRGNRPCQSCDPAPLPSSVLDHILDQHGEELSLEFNTALSYCIYSRAPFECCIFMYNCFFSVSCSFGLYRSTKDIGMTIHKGIVVSFLPCLVAFWGFHPYMFFHFFKCFLLLNKCFLFFIEQKWNLNNIANTKRSKITNSLTMYTTLHYTKLLTACVHAHAWHNVA